MGFHKVKAVMNKRESLLQHNLDFFNSAAPPIHQRLIAVKPTSKLVFDGSGEPDIVVDGKGRYNGNAAGYAAEQLETFWKNPQRFKVAPPKPYPVQGQFFDAYTNRFLKKVLDRAEAGGIGFFDDHRTRDSYFLMIFGVGLGKHIDELIEETNCQSLMVVEPNLETFVHSLEVYDWQELGVKIHQRGGTMNVLLENDPRRLANSIIGSLRSSNPCSADGYMFFIHEETPLVHQTFEIIRNEIFAAFYQMGQFYDQALMVQNAYQILRSGKERFFVRQKEKSVDMPAFIIGSGPSLDPSMALIREMADRAVIISSGSSIRPLVKNGIMPDFQIETENIDVLPIISQVVDDHDLSNVCLVAASSVDPSIIEYFGNSIYYFRSFLPPFPVFCDSEENCLENPGPTVVNASLSFAQDAGFREIYFFGVDMGAKETGPHHAEDTYHYLPGAIVVPEDLDFCIPMAANFGGTCNTSRGLFFARNNLVSAMAANSTGRQYFNCSDGVLIDGALPLRPEDISLPARNGDKKKLVRELIDGFPVYGREQFDRDWEPERLIGSIDAFMDTMIGNFSNAAPFQDKAYLTKMMGTVRPNIDSPAILSDRPEGFATLTFQGTALMLLTVFEYYLNRVAEPEKIEEFAKIGVEEFTDSLNHLRRLAIDMIEDPINAGPPESDRSSSTIREFSDTPDTKADIPRNAPCPCGSGKKFKHCHGKIS